MITLRFRTESDASRFRHWLYHHAPSDVRVERVSPTVLVTSARAPIVHRGLAANGLEHPNPLPGSAVHTFALLGAIGVFAVGVAMIVRRVGERSTSAQRLPPEMPEQITVGYAPYGEQGPGQIEV